MAKQTWFYFYKLADQTSKDNNILHVNAYLTYEITKSNNVVNQTRQIINTNYTLSSDIVSKRRFSKNDKQTQHHNKSLGGNLYYTIIIIPWKFGI